MEEEILIKVKVTLPLPTPQTCIGGVEVQLHTPDGGD
jgi:hypothetical protein